MSAEFVLLRATLMLLTVILVVTTLPFGLLLEAPAGCLSLLRRLGSFALPDVLVADDPGGSVQAFGRAGGLVFVIPPLPVLQDCPTRHHVAKGLPA